VDALVVLLGYGPIAILVGALGAVIDWFHRLNAVRVPEFV
jgi:hypothetical protein